MFKSEGARAGESSSTPAEICRRGLRESKKPLAGMW
jgi:hypothetical protein